MESISQQDRAVGVNVRRYFALGGSISSMDDMFVPEPGVLSALYKIVIIVIRGPRSTKKKLERDTKELSHTK